MHLSLGGKKNADKKKHVLKVQGHSALLVFVFVLMLYMYPLTSTLIIQRGRSGVEAGE